jgi:hypothetical protein
MKTVLAAATVASLILLLTWLSIHAIDPQAELFDHALTELDRFVTIENALYRDVFAARAGMLRTQRSVMIRPCHPTPSLRASAPSTSGSS